MSGFCLGLGWTGKRRSGRFVCPIWRGRAGRGEMRGAATADQGSSVVRRRTKRDGTPWGSGTVAR